MYIIENERFMAFNILRQISGRIKNYMPSQYNSGVECRLMNQEVKGVYMV